MELAFLSTRPTRFCKPASTLAALLAFTGAVSLPTIAGAQEVRPSGAPAHSPPPVVRPAETPPGQRRIEEDFLAQLDTLKFEAAGLFAVISYAGWRDWKWGTARWRYNPEGWFGMNTGSGGIDKTGHGYSTYLMTEFLYLRLRMAERRQIGAALVPPLITWTLMLYVEFFDAFSVDHGFSREDLVMDTIGASASLFRNAFPAIGQAFDFRMEYYPSSREGGFHPMIDYSGQKFLFALRPSGIPLLDSTPLRFTELYLGYYTRGFLDKDDPLGKRARLYMGVGLDLEELVTSQLGRAEDNPGSAIDFLSTALRMFQVPYDYPKKTLRGRHADY